MAQTGHGLAFSSQEQRVFDELVNVVTDPNEAVLIVTKAGFPRSMTPAFASPILFWSKVAGSIKGGALEDRNDLLPVISQAAKMFPGNLPFRRYLAYHGARKQDRQLIPECQLFDLAEDESGLHNVYSERRKSRTRYISSAGLLRRSFRATVLFAAGTITAGFTGHHLGTQQGLPSAQTSPTVLEVDSEAPHSLRIEECRDRIYDLRDGYEFAITAQDRELVISGMLTECEPTLRELEEWQWRTK